MPIANMALTPPCDIPIVIANSPLGMMDSVIIALKLKLNLSMRINMQKKEITAALNLRLIRPSTRVLTLLPQQMDCLLPLEIAALNLRLIRQTPPLTLPPTPPAPISPRKLRPILVSLLHLAHSILFCSVPPHSYPCTCCDAQNPNLLLDARPLKATTSRDTPRAKARPLPSRAKNKAGNKACAMRMEVNPSPADAESSSHSSRDSASDHNDHHQVRRQ
jgi:hypothetical protein